VTLQQTEPSIDLLTDREREALLDSAVWYAKYHSHIITERADDRSAYAVAQRERYAALHSALWKLGVRIRRPGGLDADAA
jgi:hypothetical protein